MIVCDAVWLWSKLPSYGITTIITWGGLVLFWGHFSCNHLNHISWINVGDRLILISVFFNFSVVVVSKYPEEHLPPLPPPPSLFLIIHASKMALKEFVSFKVFKISLHTIYLCIYVCLVKEQNKSVIMLACLLSLESSIWAHYCFSCVGRNLENLKLNRKFVLSAFSLVS